MWSHHQEFKLLHSGFPVHISSHLQDHCLSLLAEPTSIMLRLRRTDWRCGDGWLCHCATLVVGWLVLISPQSDGYWGLVVWFGPAQLRLSWNVWETGKTELSLSLSLSPTLTTTTRVPQNHGSRVDHRLHMCLIVIMVIVVLRNHTTNTAARKMLRHKNTDRLLHPPELNYFQQLDTMTDDIWYTSQFIKTSNKIRDFECNTE